MMGMWSHLPIKDTSQLSIELWVCKISGLLFLISWYKTAKALGLTGRGMATGKNLNCGCAMVLQRSAMGLPGWQTMETLWPRSRSIRVSWIILISCPPQPTAASECKTWRGFKEGIRYQKSWICCTWTANNLTYPSEGVDPKTSIIIDLLCLIWFGCFSGVFIFLN